MFRDGLRHPVKYATEVVELSSQLHLHDDDVTTLVFRLYIDPVELVGGVLLIALALQNLDNLHLLAREDSDQTLQYGKVGLIAKHALHGPVKPYVFFIYLHTLLHYLFHLAFANHPLVNSRGALVTDVALAYDLRFEVLLRGDLCQAITGHLTVDFRNL